MAQIAELYQIESFIDTFALGHYARVLEAVHLPTSQRVAFKLMRPEHVNSDGEASWEFRAFGNEAQILDRLKNSPHVIRLLDCGYIAVMDEAPAPDGEIISMGPDAIAFTRSMTDFAQKGWRPYLSLELLPRAENMFYTMRPGQQSTRRRLPTEEGLTLALQFVNVLQMAHDQKIAYLDHKLEHIYWDGRTLRIIDFNSSQQLVGSASDAQTFKKDIHNLCVGILYPLFTGMSPQKTTLRPQPGGMEEVNARYADVTELDFMMEPTLSQGVRDVLQLGAAFQYDSLQEFTELLQQAASMNGRDFTASYTTPANREARDRVRRGLENLREGETMIREARDLFRDALIIEGISDDIASELRRLVRATNELLNHRVIP